MKSAEVLAGRIQFVERELGPCLLLIKCYELAERPAAQIVSVARQVSQSEVGRLAEMTSRGFGPGPLSEQFVRAIYALHRSGSTAQAAGLLRRFIDRMTPDAGLSAQIAMKLAVAVATVGDRSGSAESLLGVESFGGRVVRSLRSANVDALDAVIEELEQAIDLQETADNLDPGRDGWEYLLLHILRKASASIRRPQ